MYWELKEAIRELKRRQKNVDLLKKVRDILGDNCPIPFDGKIKGFLRECVANAGFRGVRFEKMCEESKLEPVILNSPSASVLALNNPNLRKLIQLKILKKGDFQSSWMVIDLLEDINKINGTPPSSIKTKWGEPLIDFHYRTRKIVGLKGEVVDISSWAKKNKWMENDDKYFKNILIISLGLGILFERFCPFTLMGIVPLRKQLSNYFNCFPLIVHYSLPEEEEYGYPPEIIKAIPRGVFI